MELLTLRYGPTRVALAAHQVERLHAWPEPVDYPVVGLARALGVRGPEADAPFERVLLCGGAHRVGFGVPVELGRDALEGPDLFRLPRALARLSPPRWLGGIARFHQELALVIDLHALAESVLGRRAQGELG